MTAPLFSVKKSLKLHGQQVSTIPGEGLENIKTGILKGFKDLVQKHGLKNVKLERNSCGLKYTFWIDDNEEKKR